MHSRADSQKQKRKLEESARLTVIERIPEARSEKG